MGESEKEINYFDEYELALEELGQGRKKEALERFKKLGNYQYAKVFVSSISDELKTREKFDEEVGDKSTFVERAVKAAYPDEYEKYRAAQAAARRYPVAYGTGYIVWFVLALVAALFMHRFPDFDSMFLFAAFVFTFASGVHERFIKPSYRFDNTTSYWVTIGITAVSIFLLRAVNEAVLPSFLPLMLLQDVAAAVLAVGGLLHELRARPGTKLRKQARQYHTFLNEQGHKIKEELRVRYEYHVGAEIAARWVSEIRGFPLF